MKGTRFAIGSALAALVNQAQANSDMVTLLNNGNAYIQEASATLVLPKLPSPVSGDVSIWSAIMMEDRTSFLQGVTSNSPSGSYCKDGGKNWCNFAYSLIVEGFEPTAGDPVTAFPGSEIKTHYKLNPSTQFWDQNVYVDGKLLSTVSSKHGDIFYISIECASGTCTEHPHTGVSVVLSEADQSFMQTGSWNHGATGGAMSTIDGGKTWTFGAINVPAQKAQ